ncbi:MAG TPA: thioesterase family protein [Verrucomicrobiae bacterium]|nr:thioesterase family protein [Verrucomicrobiae bacterium]
MRKLNSAAQNCDTKSKIGRGYLRLDAGSLRRKLSPMFRYTHRVVYAECTVGNHVYHSRYLDILEAARGEYFRALGSTVLHWQNHGAIFPVIEAKLRYKFPARYDDVLAVEVWPTLLDKIRINFGHRILNQENKLILEAETFHVCTSVDEKPKRIPQELAEILQPLVSQH